MESKKTKGDLNEILFEHRNKTYGAYSLRKNYDNRILFGFLFTLSFILLIAGAPKFFKNSILPIVDVDITDTTKIIFVTDALPIEKPKVEKLVEKTTKSVNDKLIYTTSDSTDTQKPDSTNLLANNDPNNGKPGGNDSLQIGFNNPIGGGGKLPKDPTKIIAVPDKQPEFPGGYSALQKFLSGNIKYPQRAFDDKVYGKVWLSFVVDETGKIKEVKYLNEKFGLGLEEEAMRVVKMMPEWTPGVYQGENVSVLFKLPVNFKIK